MLRAVPELRRSAAAERDRPRFPRRLYAGLTDSGTGVEVNLCGASLGVKLGWVEGIEINLLGLVAGLDLRHPGVKLPGFGRIGVGIAGRHARCAKISSRRICAVHA